MTDLVDPLERTKRGAYLCACLLGIPIDALGWLRLSEDPAIAASYGAIVLTLVVTAVIAVSPIPLPIAERIGFTIAATAYLCRLAVVLFLTPDLGAEFGELITSLVILCCVYLLAFLIFRRRVALVLALGVLACSGMLIGTALLLVRPAELPHSGMPLLKAFVMQAILVALLYILAVTKEQMSTSQAREQTLTEMATTDALTGTPNRRHLTAALERETADAARSGRPLSVLMIDVDRFKDVNDTHGHEVGDRVLRHVAAVLADEVRATDTFGRWGGEEFLVIAVDSDVEDAERLALRCRARLHERPSPQAGAVTASFGVATLGSHGWEALVRAADRALYAAKERGRDRVATDRAPGSASSFAAEMVSSAATGPAPPTNP